MLRSLSLKMFVVCASVVSLAATASAQEPYGDNPFSKTGPAVQQTTFTDNFLDQMFHYIDPQCRMEMQLDGSKLYTFFVTRKSGVKLPMVVIVSGEKVSVSAMVKDPYFPPIPVEDVNRNLSELNPRITPVTILATSWENNQAIFLAMQTIDRSVTDDTFAEQWNNFLQTAEDLRIQCQH